MKDQPKDDAISIKRSGTAASASLAAQFRADAARSIGMIVLAFSVGLSVQLLTNEASALALTVIMAALMASAMSMFLVAMLLDYRRELRREAVRAVISNEKRSRVHTDDPDGADQHMEN